MWTWIKTQAKNMGTELADWIADRKWYVLAALILILIGCAVWSRDYFLRREISSLRSEYAQNLDKVKTLEAETTKLKNELAAKTEALAERQAANDETIREAAKNAYTEAHNISDDDLLDAFDEFVRGVRERNAERERRQNLSEQ